MKKIVIEEVANGYIVTVTKQGNQSMYDEITAFIANDINEINQIVSDNA